MPQEKQKKALDAYRSTVWALRAAESRLAEYASAVEEFGLDLPGADPAPVRMRCGWMEPGEIRARAMQEALEVERLTKNAAADRRDVLAAILEQSGDQQEYWALRRAYIDTVDAAG